MHKRPTYLRLAPFLPNTHLISWIYRELIITHGEFFAARYIVDIVDHYNHINDIGGECFK